MFVVSAACALGAAMLGGCASRSPEAPVMPGDPRLSRSGTHRVELDADRFQRIAAQQIEPNWCWAACTEMALKYRGVNDVDQATLVTVFKPGASKEEQAANKAEVVRALAYAHQRNTAPAPRAWNEYARITLSADSLVSSWLSLLRTSVSRDQAVEDLGNGLPVLLGLTDYQGFPGHIVMVTAIDYNTRSRIARDIPILKDAEDAVKQVIDPLNPNALYMVVRIEIYDPFPYLPDVNPYVGKDGRGTLSRDDLKRCAAFWISETRAVEIVQQQDEFITLR